MIFDLLTLNCAICEGKGGWREDVRLEDCFPWNACSICDGIGKLTLLRWISVWLWEHVPVGIIEWLDGRGTERGT